MRRGARGFLAYGIVVGSFVVAAAGVGWLLVQGTSPIIAVGVGIGWTLSGVLTIWAVEAGEWDAGHVRRPQQVAAASLLLGAVAVVLIGIARGIALLLEHRDYGTTPAAAAPAITVAAFGAFVIALLLTVVPVIASRRRQRRGALTAASVGAVFFFIAGLTTAAAPGCGSFEFSPERWRTEMVGEGGPRLVRMAEAVDRCGIVDEGMTRSEVDALLGRPPSRILDQYLWALGDDGGLFSEQKTLAIRYGVGATDRVGDVSIVSY
jgi:hypothetical protein